MNPIEASENLMAFIAKAPTSYHSVQAGIEKLEATGFTSLPLDQPWSLTAGASYYINIYDTSLFAFTLGEDPSGRLHIAAAHTDYPCMKLKPAPEMTDKNYAKLNVTCYGGAILNTWLDRPLSIAGKVMTKSGNIFHPTAHIIDLKKPVLVEVMIPEDDKVFPMVPAGAPISEVFDGDDLKKKQQD